MNAGSGIAWATARPLPRGTVFTCPTSTTKKRCSKRRKAVELTGRRNRLKTENSRLFLPVHIVAEVPDTPRRTRTCNLRFRRPVLYPIELGVRDVLSPTSKGLGMASCTITSPLSKLGEITQVVGESNVFRRKNKHPPAASRVSKRLSATPCDTGLDSEVRHGQIEFSTESGMGLASLRRPLKSDESRGNTIVRECEGS